jgi:hypothetical protein
MTDRKLTGMYELLDALEGVIKTSNPAKREELSKTIDAYHNDFPEDFRWAIGAQSPTLLSLLLLALDWACRSDAQSKSPTVIRLIDRKPEGNA